MTTALVSKKKELVKKCLENGLLVSMDVINDAQTEGELEKLYEQFLGQHKQAVAVLSKDLEKLKDVDELDWKTLEKSKALQEKTGTDAHQKIVSSLQETEQKEEKNPHNVQVVFSYEDRNEKKEMSHFVSYYTHRLQHLKKILQTHQDMKNHISIKHILNKKFKEHLSTVGMVTEKSVTKNGNIMITIEDQTGKINVLANKNKPELFQKADDIVVDEVIGVVGVNGEKIIFANELVFPDIPFQELKKSPDEVYAAFLSDLHVGSNNFLPGDFQKFLDWINGRTGTEKQKEIANKIKYIFIAGDLVDGVGVYPNQDQELTLPDIYEQYKECARLLEQIPKHIPLIICAGNHDAVRLAEPQPPLPKEYCEDLHQLPNAYFVSNPSLVNIHASDDFPGFNIFMYHGYSFDYFVSEVNSLRMRGGYDRADLIMKFLLQRRHVGPPNTCSPHLPDTRYDPLVIESIPDFFISGHIHKTAVANYRNVTMISGSCWQSKTDFQEKVGHHPEPSRVPIVNLRTRDVKVLRFGEQ